MDGFSPSEGWPSHENVKAFVRFLSEGIEEAPEEETDTWDDVLDLAYSKLAFFRVYYCGEDPADMPKIKKFYSSKRRPSDLNEVRPSGSGS